MQPSPLNRIRQYFGSPVDGGSLAVFRIGFGALTAWMIYEFLKQGPVGPNGLSFLFTPPETTWTFPYPGLAWLNPYPEPWTTVLFVVCFLSACLVSLGLLYRVASVVLCLTYWHIVLMEATLFGNHFPLIGVFTVLLAVIPAHRRYSLDRLIVVGLWRRRRPTTLSFWFVFLVRAQTFLIYFYGGVSKLHDDWLRGQPIRMWFSPEGLYPFFGDKLSEDAFARLSDFLSHEFVVYFFSYSGLVFDLTIGFLLIIRRTRWLAFALATSFHFFNYFVIQHVGLVAPIAFWATLVFFEPDWPTRLWSFLRRPHLAKPDWAWLIAGAIAVPGVGALLGWKAKPSVASPAESTARTLRWPVFVITAAWITFQALLPARHFLIPDDPYWTERGVRFSWFLMTRNKVGGFARIRVEDPQLVRTDVEGRPEFDWDNFQGERPPVVYYDVDARTVSWKDLPEFFVTFEPMIGERIFFNPTAAGLVQTSEIEEYVQVRWRKMYGRSCELYPTFPLRRQFRTLRHNAAIALRDKEPGAREYLGVVQLADERAKMLLAPNLDEDAFYRQFFSFKESLFQFQRLGPFAEPLARVLVQTSPFALQGNPAAGLRPMFIHDPELLLAAPHVFQRINRERWRGEATVYADFNTLPWQFMQGLPRVLPAYRLEQPPWFVWNYGVDLNAHQIEAMELMPLVIYSYAQHVAELWQAEQGHRPRVFGTTFVLLNDRPMQKIVDPDVDLAAAINSPFGENPWILPPPPPPVEESEVEEIDAEQSAAGP